MREDYYPNENCYPRSEYYPVGYREDEEMWVYDQCCANCARSQANCPFLAYANREKVSRAKRKAVKEDAVVAEQELKWCIHWKQIRRHRF